MWWECATVDTDMERVLDKYLVHGKKCCHLHKEHLFRNTEKNPEIILLLFRYLRKWYEKMKHEQDFFKKALINRVRDIFQFQTIKRTSFCACASNYLRDLSPNDRPNQNKWQKLMRFQKLICKDDWYSNTAAKGIAQGFQSTN